MSGPVIQISRGALMAVSAGAGSLYLFINGQVPPGLASTEFGRTALMLANGGVSTAGQQVGQLPDHMRPLAEQLGALSSEVARLRLQSQYGGANGYYFSGQGWGVGWSTVATAGGVGVLFLYMRGYSFADFMYVTKKALEVAVEALEQGIDALGVALETAKRELTYKLGLIEDKVDESRTALEDQISKQVGGVRNDLEVVGNDVRSISRNQDRVHSMVEGIETQIDAIEDKMENANSALTTANRGIYLLCNVVAENMQVGAKPRPPEPGRPSLYEELLSYTRSAMDTFTSSTSSTSSSSTELPVPAPAPLLAEPPRTTRLTRLMGQSVMGTSSRSLVEDVITGPFTTSTKGSKAFGGSNNNNNASPVPYIFSYTQL